MTITTQPSASDDFYRLLNQAKTWLEAVTAVSVNTNPQLALIYMQQSAELTLKAIIVSQSAKVSKTRNPYRLWKQALLLAPAIAEAFPMNSAYEKRLFHWLKPSFNAERGDTNSSPTNDDLRILTGRIQQLQTIAEAGFLNHFNSPTKP